jgi:deoxycytidylate deaminase
MKMLKLNLNNNEYYDFIDLIDNCINCEYPIINSKIAEIVMRKIKEKED